MQKEIIHFLKHSPYAKENDVRKHLELIYGRNISLSTSRSFLKKLGFFSFPIIIPSYYLGWSWRIPNRFQANKYSFTNLYYYTQYLLFISTIPIEKLKFADESHVVCKDLASKRVLGMKLIKAS